VDVRDLVLKEHADWNVTARRVNKLVKPVKKGGVLQGLKGVFRKKDKMTAPATKERNSQEIAAATLTTPTKDAASVATTALSVDSPNSPPVRTVTTTKNETCESPLLDKGGEVLSGIYHDDNDGMRITNICEPCEGCTIL
jgi:hypothetical protein